MWPKRARCRVEHVAQPQQRLPAFRVHVDLRPEVGVGSLVRRQSGRGAGQPGAHRVVRRGDGRGFEGLHRLLTPQNKHTRPGRGAGRREG